jgi:hypothetical protein
MGKEKSDQSASSTSEPASEVKPVTGAFSISQEPVTHPEGAAEVEVEVHKYEATPGGESPAPPGEEPLFEDLGELPASYDEDQLYAVARDPRWLFTYWDFDWSRYPASGMRHGLAQFFLRITTDAGAEVTTLEIQPAARNWYVPVGMPEATYFAEIGYFAQGGDWTGHRTFRGGAHTCG